MSEAEDSDFCENLLDRPYDRQLYQTKIKTNRFPTQQLDVPHKVVTVVRKKLDMDLYQFSNA